MNSRRRFLLKTGVLPSIISLASGAEDPPGKEKDPNWDAIRSDPSTVALPRRNLETLKSAIPWVSKWWTLEFKKSSFAVCLQEWPSLGQARIDVHAWRQKNDKSPFEHVWTFRSTGIGLIEVVIEEKKGTISVYARSESELKDAVLASILLGATTG